MVFTQKASSSVSLPEVGCVIVVTLSSQLLVQFDAMMVISSSSLHCLTTLGVGVGKPVHITSCLNDLFSSLTAPMSHSYPARGVIGNIVLCFAFWLTKCPAVLYASAFSLVHPTWCPTSPLNGHVALVCQCGTSKPHEKHMFQLLNLLYGVGVKSCFPAGGGTPPGL